MATKILVKDLIVGTSARCAYHNWVALRPDEEKCSECVRFEEALNAKFPLRAIARRDCTVTGWGIKKENVYDVFAVVQSSNVRHNTYGLRGWMLYVKQDDKDSPVAGELFPFDALEIFRD